MAKASIVAVRTASNLEAMAETLTRIEAQNAEILALLHKPVAAPQVAQPVKAATTPK